jgi:predicted dehydrogenase
LLRALGIDPPAEWETADAWPLTDAVPSVLATARSGDARIVLAWLWLPGYPVYRERVRVLARSGGVELEIAPPYVVDAASTLRITSAEGGLRGETVLAGGPESGFVHQLDAFADVIAGRRAPLSDAAGAAADTRSMQALVRAVGERHGIAVGGEAAR